MKKYVEVDREPVVGDMVKIVKLDEVVPHTNGIPDYKLGDILKIINICEIEGYRYKEGRADDKVERVLNEEEFVVVEELEQFTKSDLKPFMLVKLRRGDLCIVSQSKLGVSFNSEFGFMSFYSYNDELLCFDDGEREEYYDVMEVYDISNKYYDANKLSTDNRELLFKREEQSQRDIKIKELQDKMDAIKREMEELK